MQFKPFYMLWTIFAVIDDYPQVSRSGDARWWGRQFFWVTVYLLCVLVGILIILLPWTLVSLLFIAVFLALLLLRTEMGLMYLLISMALLGRTLLGFDFDTSWSNNGTIFPFYMPFLFAVLLARTIKGLPHIDSPANKSAYVSLTLFLALWGVMSLIWTENKLHGLLVQLELILNISIFLYCLYALRSEATLRKAMWFWTCFAVVVGFICLVRLYIPFGPFQCDYEIVNNIFLRGGIGSVQRRAMGIANPNASALFLNISIAVALSLWATERDKLQVWMLSVIVLFFVFVLLSTGSKGGLISLFVLTFYLLVVFRHFRKRILRNSLVCFTLLVLLITTIHILRSSEGEYRVTAALTGGVEGALQEDTSFSSRLGIWKDGWSALVEESAGLGLGPGGFTHHCAPHPHAHNIYFSIIFDFGLAGLLFLMLFSVALLRNMAISLRNQETRLQILLVFLSSGLVALAAHGLVDHMYSRTVLWLYLGVVAAAALLSTKKDELVMY